MTIQIKTASWFVPLPPDHVRVGISRGVPRHMAAGYRIYRKLAPGPWFNSVGPMEYYDLYRNEILAKLDPRQVCHDLRLAAGQGRIPVMACYEPANGIRWCHRSMAAEWLARWLGEPVPEFGFEERPQEQHPMFPAILLAPAGHQRS